MAEKSKEPHYHDVVLYKVIGQDVDQSLEEMLFNNNVLNRSVLGAGDTIGDS